MVDIPTLTTERLILRPMAMDDWPEYAALMQSDRAIFMCGPHTRAEAWGMFCQDIAQWSLLGLGALMFDERTSGKCLGQIGINHGPLDPEHELGWYVYAEAEGKGFAFEAANALRDWALNDKCFPTLVSCMDPQNTKSRNLAERLGARLDASAKPPHKGDLVLRHW